LGFPTEATERSDNTSGKRAATLKRLYPVKKIRGSSQEFLHRAGMENLGIYKIQGELIPKPIKVRADACNFQSKTHSY
jgi:hypothetical protein